MKNLLAILLLMLCGQSFAQPVRLSEHAQFSLLTLGPDQAEFYEAFGHTAFRLVDPVKGIDYTYNYGVFSFNQPNFYLNFAKGHLNYSLGVHFYPDFKDAYISANRFINEQVLNLNVEQKQKIFEYLEWNALPENRNYLYDYFFNNCSTKIRDVLSEVLKDDIHFDQSFIKTDYTIRQLTDLYLIRQPWGDLGIDIGLGSRIDKKATPYEYMFLPDYLEYSFDHATIRSNGVVQPLVRMTNKVFIPLPEGDEPGWLSPLVALGIVLALTGIITFYDLKRKKLSVWFDFILFSVTGVVGLVLLLLWFATDHHACAKNYNLVWALPTNLVVIGALLMRKRPLWLALYFKAAGLAIVVVLALWYFLPQQLNAFLIPMLLALAVRYFANWYFARK